KVGVRGNARPFDPTRRDQPDGPPARGGRPPTPLSEYMVLATDAPLPPFEVTGRWLTPSPLVKASSLEQASPTDQADQFDQAIPTDQIEAVVRADTAAQIDVAPGDAITLVDGDRELRAVVVGLLQTP